MSPSQPQALLLPAMHQFLWSTCIYHVHRIAAALWGWDIALHTHLCRDAHKLRSLPATATGSRHTMWVAHGGSHLAAGALDVHAEDAEGRQLEPLPCRHWAASSPPGLQSPTLTKAGQVDRHAVPTCFDSSEHVC